MNRWVRRAAAIRLLFLRGMAFGRLWQQFAIVAILLKQWEIPLWPWMLIGIVLTCILSVGWGYFEDRLGLLEAEQQFYARRTPMLRDIRDATAREKP